MYRRDKDSLEIDVGDARTPQELQDLLFEAFRFPDYYGRNWDAFDECIWDVEVPGVVRIINFDRLRSVLPREAELMSACLSDFVREDEPQIEVRIA